MRIMTVLKNPSVEDVFIMRMERERDARGGGGGGGGRGGCEDNV